jgi:hypothetical protein
VSLWHQYPFDFRLRNNRLTKAGDFTVRTNRPSRVTVNRDLHPFLFLVTYIHEVAHVAVHREHGNRVPGHGREWKQTFQNLLGPLLNEEVFPAELLLAIRRHMEDPKATTFSDPVLMQVFRKFDAQAKPQTLLSEIPEGSVFGLRGRWFRKGVTKRTRVLCQEMKTRKKYLVPADAVVENVQLTLL